MKFLTKSLILALILVPSILLPTVSAQVSPSNLTTSNFFVATGTESITVDSTGGGKAFTSAKLNPSTGRTQVAQFRVECSAASPCQIRYTIDGTAPTTSVGFILNEGDIATIYNAPNLVKFRAIRTGANSAIIQPIYYR